MTETAPSTARAGAEDSQSSAPAEPRETVNDSGPLHDSLDHCARDCAHGTGEKTGLSGFPNAILGPFGVFRE